MLNMMDLNGLWQWLMWQQWSAIIGLLLYDKPIITSYLLNTFTLVSVGVAVVSVILSSCCSGSGPLPSFLSPTYLSHCEKQIYGDDDVNLYVRALSQQTPKLVNMVHTHTHRYIHTYTHRTFIQKCISTFSPFMRLRDLCRNMGSDQWTSDSFTYIVCTYRL